MLKINNIKKQYKGIEVLKGINLNVEKGETLVIVGPSGGGKTTLLRCINALEKADEGSIIIDGESICSYGKYVDKKQLARVRKNIGMVFQNYNLFPHMTVMENLIEAPIKVLGLSRENAIEKSEEILKFLGLDSKADSYPCELSGGQKQRVAIGRALAMEPKVMCFDEPTSALDPALTDDVCNLIKGLGERGMSNVIITHDMDFARKVSDRIFSMDKGILKEGLIFEN